MNNNGGRVSRPPSGQWLWLDLRMLEREAETLLVMLANREGLPATMQAVASGLEDRLEKALAAARKGAR